MHGNSTNGYSRIELFFSDSQNGDRDQKRPICVSIPSVPIGRPQQSQVLSWADSMNSTRPIPIGTSGSSQRGSPVAPSFTGRAMVSHSLPVAMHHVHLSRFRTSASSIRSNGLQPPGAPRVGSMPEPHFLLLDSMPDLALGPPAEIIHEESPPQCVSSSSVGQVHVRAGFLSAAGWWSVTCVDVFLVC